MTKRLLSGVKVAYLQAGITPRSPNLVSLLEVGAKTSLSDTFVRSSVTFYPLFRHSWTRKPDKTPRKSWIPDKSDGFAQSGVKVRKVVVLRKRAGMMDSGLIIVVFRAGIKVELRVIPGCGRTGSEKTPEESGPRQGKSDKPAKVH